MLPKVLMVKVLDKIANGSYSCMNGTDRIPKRALNYNPKKKRGGGRPHIRMTLAETLTGCATSIFVKTDDDYVLPTISINLCPTIGRFLLSAVETSSVLPFHTTMSVLYAVVVRRKTKRKPNG